MIKPLILSHQGGGVNSTTPRTFSYGVQNTMLLSQKASVIIYRHILRTFQPAVQYQLGKTHIKKWFFFSDQTIKVLPSLHQWLRGPCHFFFYQSYNSQKRILTIFLFSSQFLAYNSRILKNFAQWSEGFTLPTPLMVRPTKKHFFMCVFPK